jgi:hypothetical protein
MVSVSRRSTVALAISCGVLLASQALLVSVPTSASSGSSCTELKRWAQSYGGTSPTLDQLTHYDRAHRVAIFNAISPQVKATLWQDQLHRFDQRTDLTTTQHNLIAEVQTYITPRLYTHEDKALTSAFDELTPRVKAAFPSQEHKGFLTDVAFTGIAPKPQIMTMWDQLTNPFVVHAQATPCNCNTGTGWAECWSGFCAGGSCITQGGCGLAGEKTCNGTCR